MMKDFLEEEGLSQHQVANMVGYDQALISRVANGHPASAAFKIQWLKVFGAEGYKKAFGDPTMIDPAIVWLAVNMPDKVEREQVTE